MVCHWVRVVTGVVCRVVSWCECVGCLWEVAGDHLVLGWECVMGSGDMFVAGELLMSTHELVDAGWLLLANGPKLTLQLRLF